MHHPSIHHNPVIQAHQPWAVRLIQSSSSYFRLKKCWEELNSILESEKELEEASEYKEARNVWLEAKKIYEAEPEQE